jgi:two-component system phosphate regulon sensor histidine kinase PhoR
MTPPNSYRGLVAQAIGGNAVLLALVGVGSWLTPSWGPPAVIGPVAAVAVYNGLMAWRVQRSLQFLGRLARSLADPLDYNIPSVTPDLPQEVVDVAADMTRAAQPPRVLAPAGALGKTELMAVINSMSEGLIIYDRQMNVLLLNPALAQLLIPQNPAATGRLVANPHDRIFFERAVDKEAVADIWRAMQEQPELPRTDIIDLAHPEQVLKRYCAPLLDETGERIGHVVLYHDVSAEAAAERVRREFIADASHELRTPVTSIKVLVESLVDGAKDDPDLVTSFCEDLLVEADRLHQLVNHLLDLSRYEAGEEVLRLTRVEPYRLSETVLATVGPLARQRGVTVVNEVLGDALPIWADQVRVTQVLMNLLTNAVKFTPADGTVYLRLTCRSDAAEWQVQDTGIGIPGTDLPYVFDRFYRVNRDRNRSQGGSGLGLTIVKRAVEAHGGRIWVDSDRGGTTFTFTLPNRPPAAEAPVSGDAVPADGAAADAGPV